MQVQAVVDCYYHGSTTKEQPCGATNNTEQLETIYMMLSLWKEITQKTSKLLCQRVILLKK